jgi:ABC-2 type transport system ATP-binding protein
MMNGMSVPALEFDGVSKSFGDTQAVDDLSLSVEPGSFLGLLGPNGAGKTTAMHLATGLATLDEGTIEVFGHDVVDDYREARRRIGLAPQEANFDRFFSALDCLTYQGGYFGLSTQESRERALELLEMFELSDKKDARPNQLSGGQKRRLLIAKAVIHDPDIVILDEPSASLDVELRHKLWDYLESLKEIGKTMILTTHYVEEVEALAERVAIMQHGELILEDTLENILEEYGKYTCVLDVKDLDDSLRRQIRTDFPFIEIEDGTLRANRRSFDEEIGDLLTRLVSGGASVEGLRFEETRLEDIFLRRVDAQ